MALTSIARRLRRSIRRSGWRGTAREAVHAFTQRGRRKEAARRELAFDRRYGVETAGIVRLDDLAFRSASKVHGTRYEAITPEAFQGLLERVDLGAGDLTFIDLGSGKGRAVLLAALYPFRRIVGVEFSPELTAIARRNVEIFQPPDKRCDEIELLCEDAAAYRFPDEPSLVYIYNSFEGPLMQRVLANLGASAAAQPRRLLLATVNRSYPAAEIEAIGFRSLNGADDLFELIPAVRPDERSART